MKSKQDKQNNQITKLKHEFLFELARVQLESQIMEKYCDLKKKGKITKPLSDMFAKESGLLLVLLQKHFYNYVEQDYYDFDGFLVLWDKYPDLSFNQLKEIYREVVNSLKSGFEKEFELKIKD